MKETMLICQKLYCSMPNFWHMTCQSHIEHIMLEVGGCTLRVLGIFTIEADDALVEGVIEKHLKNTLQILILRDQFWMEWISNNSQKMTTWFTFEEIKELVWSFNGNKSHDLDKFNFKNLKKKNLNICIKLQRGFHWEHSNECKKVV